MKTFFLFVCALCCFSSLQAQLPKHLRVTRDTTNFFTIPSVPLKDKTPLLDSSKALVPFTMLPFNTDKAAVDMPVVKPDPQIVYNMPVKKLSGHTSVRMPGTEALDRAAYEAADSLGLRSPQVKQFQMLPKR